jgi:hypothetical protein
MAGGEPGTDGDVLHFSSSPLRLLAMSSVDGPPSKGVSAWPELSQFAFVDISGGRVWVGSDGTVGCLSPSSRTVLATYGAYHGPALIDSFIVVGREMWANSNMGGPPPPTCGVHVFLPLLLEQDEGHIVNTASLAGLGGVPSMGLARVGPPAAC